MNTGSHQSLGGSGGTVGKRFCARAGYWCHHLGEARQQGQRKGTRQGSVEPLSLVCAAAPGGLTVSFSAQSASFSLPKKRRVSNRSGDLKGEQRTGGHTSASPKRHTGVQRGQGVWRAPAECLKVFPLSVLLSPRPATSGRTSLSAEAPEARGETRTQEASQVFCSCALAGAGGSTSGRR